MFSSTGQFIIEYWKINGNFLVETKQYEKKIYWISLRKLCLPKHRERLGFKELKAFNLALLAKQWWHIMSDSNSLLHQIYKDKYFPQKSFVEASLGRNKRLIVECHCLSMEQACSSNVITFSEMGSMITEIKNVQLLFEEYYIQHIYREQNMPAHLLARHAWSIDIFVIWDVIPEFISQAIWLTLHLVH